MGCLDVDSKICSVSGSDALLQPGHHGAFVAEGFGAEIHVNPTSDALAGLSIAAKDVMDVAGFRTGVGNPTWLSQSTPARESALSLQLVLSAGGHWVGKTVTDELAYSLTGINSHYGTPVNPASPQRIPGGSSSGSAVAVAAGHVDIALGTDCAGSMRLPASFCGVWGMRPTHGRIPKNGSFSLAPSFDTLGWFASNGMHMAKTLAVLTRTEAPRASLPTLWVPEDALALCDDTIREAFASMVIRLRARCNVSHAPCGTLPLRAWRDAHRVLQMSEIWQQHGRWVELHGEGLGADVLERFRASSRVTIAQVAAAQLVRVEASESLARRLSGALLLMPTVPTLAPERSCAEDNLATLRLRWLQLLSMAGLAGLPEVSLPWTSIDGATVGLSILGPRGADEAVLSAAMFVHDVVHAAATSH
jgi:Asp-tRNA(Asn)/Glu-tRNA(Gln) amidotransferase A subunit family amidase